MSSTTGKNIKISVFGQSHSEAIGVVIDGLKAGFRLDFDKINEFMRRRSPGHDKFSTPRSEDDIPVILSGITDGKTCGAPLCAMIKNTNTKSSDYKNIIDCPRPSHADYAAYVKFGGNNDVSGGGHFSGRLTAPLCFAGAVCMQILEEKGIQITAHIKSIMNVSDESFNPVNVQNTDIASKDFPVISDDAGERMKQVILDAKEHNNSVGGVIECAVTGIEAGYGSPMFDGIENLLAKNLFAIPAVKGVEFGNGFGCTTLMGSENNDSFRIENGKVVTETNNSGGINGGITNGMPIIFRIAIKPTPSIGLPQDSVSIEKNKNTTLTIKGRHDPCIVKRAIPVTEAVAAFTVLDIISEGI